MTASLTAIARAKVNLTLHVTGRRADGYRLLDSLVVFPEIGDRLTVEPANDLSLNVTGPFANALQADTDNLILRAARTFTRGRGAHLALTKHLPVAAGIGGGSADAAAALRLLSKLWGEPIKPTAPQDLGADVLACVGSVPCRMRGIGEQIAPLLGMPPLWLVLANRGHGVPTGAVFAAMQHDAMPPMPEFPVGLNVEEFANWLLAQRNDLGDAALTVDPGIEQVLVALEGQKDCLLARMSGSGGTCFGLFADCASATSAARTLGAAEPAWWVKAAQVRAAPRSDDP